MTTGWEGTTAAGAATEPEPEPAAKAPEPEPEKAPEPVVDKRQRWTCVETSGPRHHVKADGPPCPVFHSDAHLMSPPELVRCATCGSTSVRKAFDGEV